MPSNTPATQLDRSQIHEELARAEVAIEIAKQSNDMNHMERAIKRKNELNAEMSIIMKDEPTQIRKIIDNAGKKGVKLEDAMNPKKYPGPVRQTTIMVPKKTPSKPASKPATKPPSRKKEPSSGLKRILNGRINKNKKHRPIAADGTPFLLKGPPK